MRPRVTRSLRLSPAGRRTSCAKAARDAQLAKAAPHQSRMLAGGVAHRYQEVAALLGAVLGVAREEEQQFPLGLLGGQREPARQLLR